MQGVRPQILFVSGPQTGQRVYLMSDEVLLGRSPSCQIVIVEEFVSRRHCRFTLTEDGWIAENLSDAGTRINRKKYKRGKRILLDTSDLLHVGRDTRMLFVLPEDDPDEALAAFLEKNPQFKPAESEPRSEPVGEEEPLPEPDEARTAPVQVSLADEAAETAEDALAAQRKAKIRKYAILFGAYIVVLAVLAALFASRGCGEDTQTPQKLKILEAEQITGILTAPLERSHAPSAAAQELKNAMSYYDLRAMKPSNRYRCVRSFQLYLAYRESPDFENPQHERYFLRVRSELTRLVNDKYLRAYGYMKARNWLRAKEIYDELLLIVPERDPREPVYRKLVKNILRLSSYAARKAKETGKKN